MSALTSMTGAAAAAGSTRSPELARFRAPGSSPAPSAAPPLDAAAAAALVVVAARRRRVPYPT